MQLESKVDKAVHRNDPELVTKLEDEMKVWAYVMTQYNLKPGLRKFWVGIDCCNERANATKPDGHVDGNGLIQTHMGRSDEGFVLEEIRP